MELTPEEQREYDRQQKELNHPCFHEEVKCGLPLIPIIVKKRKGRQFAELRRLHCQTHNLDVSMTGWEIGWSFGHFSKSLNTHLEKK